MSITRPESTGSSPRPGKAKGPVKWFGIKTLITSAREDSAAAQFARFADARQAQAGVSPGYVYDLRGQLSPFHLDYVADTGDGYDATFAVARSVDGSINETEEAGTEAPQDRAHLLVLGGDEVYPVASVQEYNDRLIKPFDDAVREVRGKGFLVALPGNHDWYDGLSSFRRNFCESFLQQIDQDGPPVEFMQAPNPLTSEVLLDRWLFQSRSYFAVRLPHGWWLWGVDAQLDSYIDTAQLAYFAQARQLIERHERVIVCFPRPSWTDNPKLARNDYTTNRETMIWFLERMFSPKESPGDPGLAQVPIMVSGDKHHFVHHVRDKEEEGLDSPRHLVTCGGGGAYLSSTHHSYNNLDITWRSTDPEETSYTPRSAYPEEAVSRRLRWRFLRIPFVNGWMFPLLLAVAVAGLLPSLALISHEHVTAGVVGLMLHELVLTLALMGFSAGFHRKFPVRWLGPLIGALLGAVHATCHGALALGIYSIWKPWDGEPWAWAASIGLAALGSWLVFSLYLVVCDLGWIHWHENEFFSGMRFDSYKSHLRITISPPHVKGVAGPAQVTVFGIQNPPRNRKDGTTTSPLVHVIKTFDV